MVVLKLTLDNLRLRDHSFFNFFKGGLLKQNKGNPELKSKIIIWDFKKKTLNKLSLSEKN